MDDHRFIAVPAPGVLGGIGVHSQLMHLPKKQRIAEFFAYDLREHVPTFQGSVEAAAIRGIIAVRHA